MSKKNTPVINVEDHTASRFDWSAWESPSLSQPELRDLPWDSEVVLRSPHGERVAQLDEGADYEKAPVAGGRVLVGFTVL